MPSWSSFQALFRAPPPERKITLHFHAVNFLLALIPPAVVVIGTHEGKKWKKRDMERKGDSGESPIIFMGKDLEEQLQELQRKYAPTETAVSPEKLAELEGKLRDLESQIRVQQQEMQILRQQQSTNAWMDTIASISKSFSAFMTSVIDRLTDGRGGAS